MATSTSQLLAGKRAITPLWIVALFVSLTETVLGVAVTQTSGGIQIALTVFVLLFPLVIASLFFAILWLKPYVFYAPTDFGTQINIREYVQAMQTRPSTITELAERPDSQPPVGNQLRTADDMVDLFVSRLAMNALLYVYAFSVAHSKGIPVDFDDLSTAIRFSDSSYAMGVLSATSGTGLLTYQKAFTKLEGPSIIETRTVAKIIDMNQKLKMILPSKIDERVTNLREADEVANFSRWVKNIMLSIDEYFSDFSRSNISLTDVLPGGQTIARVKNG